MISLEGIAFYIISVFIAPMVFAFFEPLLVLAMIIISIFPILKRLNKPFISKFNFFLYIPMLIGIITFVLAFALFLETKNYDIFENNRLVYDFTYLSFGFYLNSFLLNYLILNFRKNKQEYYSNIYGWKYITINIILILLILITSPVYLFFFTV